MGERRWKTAPNEQVQPSKTLWDLLQLLIVPVILVGVSLWWSASQDTRDKNRADQVRQDTTLNDYIQQMSNLMLNKGLQSSKPRDPVRSVARTITLTTLRRLDGARKGEVVRFLEEARLIDVRESPVRLSRANLTFAYLTFVNLTFADLTDANLTDANLTGANLTGADLTHADLTHADLTGANVRDADLRDAILTFADLTFVNLTSAILTFADLTDADLTDANLTDANLTGADLTGANLRGVDLTGAQGLPERSR